VQEIEKTLKPGLDVAKKIHEVAKTKEVKEVTSAVGKKIIGKKLMEKLKDLKISIEEKKEALRDAREEWRAAIEVDDPEAIARARKKVEVKELELKEDEKALEEIEPEWDEDFEVEVDEGGA
jgi:chemotaxis regulatin CheY-phosphate phosphatase CheZ